MSWWRTAALMRRVIIVITLILSFAAITAVILQRHWEKKGVERWHPRGGFVSAEGGRRLHLWCEGKGEPAILLEASGPGNSDQYSRVLPELAKHTRTCAYDRAGMGFSDEAALPRTLQDFSRDLSAVADAVSERPIILAAASFGGVIAQDFTRRHRARVAALVLLDVPSAALVAATEAVWQRVDRALWPMPYIASLGGLRLVDPFALGDSQSAWLTYRPAVWRSVAALMASRHGAFAGLPALADDLPLRVIRHGRAGDALGPALPRAEQEAFEPQWRAAEEQLAGESRLGEVIVAENSGHLITEQAPELVVQTLTALLP